MDSQLELPSDLRFRFQLNKQLLASISMNNPGDSRIGFKIKTTAPKKYVVRPSAGVVEPHSSVSVQVIMQAQKEYPPDFQNCKDKFMVQTTTLGGKEQVDKDTFAKDERKDLREYRLRVILEGPAAPPSPVPEANENDDDSSHRAASSAHAAGNDVPDTRLRTAHNDLAALTSENSALKNDRQKLFKERDELRRQLDLLQLQSSKPAAQSSGAQGSATKSRMSIIPIILVALIAFLLGHYLR